MKNALIVHDTDEVKSRHKREDNWYEWLEDELKSKEYEVFLQEMPLAWKPNTELYWNFLKERFNFNNSSILVGHGSGAVALLGILEKVPQVKSVNKVVLVAPFLNSDKQEYKKLFNKKFNWEDIKGKSKNFYVVYSEDDEVSPASESKEIASKLGAEQKEMNDNGHFEEDELRELLDIISS